MSPALKQDNFRIGDTVIEPSLGICTIQGIRQMTVDGKQEDYFVFRAQTANVLVPRSQMSRRGIRKPMSKDEIKKLFNTLKQPVNPTRSNSRDQYLEYQDTLRSGDPSRIGKLLRNLYILDQTDDLKGKEKEIMEQAREFLVEEISFTKEVGKAKTNEQIDESLKAMYKKKVQRDKDKDETEEE